MVKVDNLGRFVVLNGIPESLIDNRLVDFFFVDVLKTRFLLIGRGLLVHYPLHSLWIPSSKFPSILPSLSLPNLEF